MVNYSPGSHHLILSLGLLYNQYEWNLLTPAYQECYHPSLDLGNTHSHNLQFFSVQLWRSSPDQFGNTKRLIKRHMAHPMAIVLKRSRAKGSTFSWRKLETVIRLKEASASCSCCCWNLQHKPLVWPEAQDKRSGSLEDANAKRGVLP